MPELELNYLIVDGPLNVQYTCQVAGFLHGVDIPDGESSADHADAAATSLCHVINVTLGLEGEDVFTLRESYRPTQSQLDQLRFERRSSEHERLSAEFGAWNLGRVRSGEFTPQEIDEWLDSPPITKILAQLRRYSFEMAISSIQSLPISGPTTQEFKDVWIPKLEAAI